MELLQNGSTSRASSTASGHCIKNGTAAIKALDAILNARETSEESEAPARQDEESDVDVPVIEEDMNLEDLMRQKVISDKNCGDLVNREFISNELQELLQARLGAYVDSGESGEASEGEVIEPTKDSKKEKVVDKSQPECISLLDDSDSCTETPVRNQT